MPPPPLPTRNGLRLRPFQAVRYNLAEVGDLSHVVSPPYDDIGPTRARALRARPHHVARLLHDDPIQAADQLDRWRQRGVLLRDSRPALYVYQQQRGARILQRGLFGEVLLSRGTPGPVLPHEAVQPHVVSDRARSMAGLHAQLEPLLLTYRSAESTTAQVVEHVTRRPPIAVARTGPVTHTLWACTAPDEQNLITTGLSQCQALIADGHHRHAACLQLSAGDAADRSPWQSSLALLVDATSHPLRLSPIHRVIPGLEPDKAVAAAADVAEVRRLPRPRVPEAGEVVIVGSGRAWAITEPDQGALGESLTGRPRRWASLTAAVADCLLLEHAWSVTDLPGAVHHLHDASHAAAAVAGSGSGTAVLLPTMTDDLVWEFAASGVLLPRKSTSFGPKPVTGLAMRVLDTDFH